MKLSDFNLSVRITAAAIALVVAGAMALLFVEETRLRDAYLGERHARLEQGLQVQKLLLIKTINTLRQDVLFLSDTPPVSGIVRAAQNHDYDARYNHTRKAWGERLQRIFSAFSAAHPDYYQIRYIGVADAGREIVRVDNRGGKPEATPSDRLQALGGAGGDFFKATLSLHEGEVHLSEFDLNREGGVIEQPPKPTLRASTPVFTPSGEIFGIVTINMAAADLLESATQGIPGDIQVYITNMDGQYLLHPDAKRAFAFELGGKDNIGADFPNLKTIFDPQTADHLDYLLLQAGATMAGGQGGSLLFGAERIHFDPARPARFLLLSYVIPDDDVAARQITVIPASQIAGGFIAMLLVGGIALLALRRTFAPLKRLTAAADKIAAGDYDVRLQQNGGGEIGILNNAFGTMLVKLSQREQDILRINAGLEERVKVRTQELKQAYLETGMLLRRNQALMQTSMDGIHMMDMRGNVLEANDAFCQMLGYTQEEVVRLNVADLDAQWSADELQVRFIELIGKSAIFETLHRRKDGTLINVEICAAGVEIDGQGFMFASSRDITARKQAEEEIHHLAFYDALTKLPNRRLFLDRFRTALPVSARYNNYGAVLFIDLDRFKLLNDTLGHDYGDLLLVEVAVRVKACVREMDTVARLGGDEFVVLIEGVSDAQDEASHKVGLVAEKIRESLACPYNLNGHEHHSSPSIGVSLYRGNEESVEDLLQHADMAMYQAKDSGRNAVRFFDPVMQNNVATRAALVNDLRSAIAQQQLHLHYQLQVDNDNRPVGAEALLRWIHPLRGMVMPEQLLPIAEESTLILDIGDWVLETACRQLVLWSEDKKARDLVLTVNISAKQFAMPNFVDKVANVLRTHQINPVRLKLELTENMALDDLPGAVEKMHALKALGVCLSMDDFGTRYSSLSNLKQLPLDQLKLGRSFVQDIASDGNVALLVQSIIDLSGKYRITVIAEGVENEAQLASLKDRDCIAYQGFLFSKALSVEEFEQLLNRS